MDSVGNQFTYLWCTHSSQSTVEDFNPIRPLVEHALVDVMRCSPSEHPILVTEPAWNTPANRERMAEIMFEELQVPAFYIANTGVLNSYDTAPSTANFETHNHKLFQVCSREGVSSCYRRWANDGKCHTRGRRLRSAQRCAIFFRH